MRRLFIVMVCVSFVFLSLVSVSHSACKGDLDCDGDIDGDDVAILAGNYGTAGCKSCDEESITEIVNVDDHGAVGNDDADDSEAISTSLTTR